ncbi:MAG: hypothetical protein ACK5XN_25280 [Bacteroidota bacterium]|jgi:hypothetical protein
MPRNSQNRKSRKGKHHGGAFPKQMSYPALAGLPVGAVSVIGGKKMRHMGSGFFSDVFDTVKNVGRAVYDGVQTALPIVKPLIGVAKPFLPGSINAGLNAVGLGRKKGGRKYRAIKG